MDNAPLLPKEGITKTLEHMFVVLIGSDVICANKQVEQVKVNNMFINRRSGGKWHNVGQLGQGLSSTRLPHQKPKKLA